MSAKILKFPNRAGFGPVSVRNLDADHQKRLDDLDVWIAKWYPPLPAPRPQGPN